MADLYKFVVDGSTVDWFEQQDDGSFAPEDLKLNQTLSLDAATGDVTLTSTYAQYVRLQVFHQTLDTTDDASLYTKPVTSFTALDGTPITGASGGGHHGADDPGIPELNQHGGADDLDHDGSDDDHVTGTTGDDTTSGGFGDDTIHGGSGKDTLSGDAGDDTLSGDLGNDRLSGGAGFDDLHGGRGNDHLNGGADDDILSGDAGSDVLHGGRGNDHLNGGANDDTLSGDAGNDTLSGGNGNDDLSGGNGVDDLSGGLGDDHAAGGRGNDSINGNAGNDTLSGNEGNDTIDGGTGDDTISGGAGKDVMTGGLGADHFTFDDGDLSGKGLKTADVITDFHHSEGDLIDLSAMDADTVTAGDQGFTFIGTDAFSHTAGELHLDISGSKMLLSGDTNGDGLADFAITLAGTTPLVLADFVL